MSSLAIILARSGSKRIPNKNIKEFCGQPLMSYPIKAALNSGCFDEVMVSTDSQEIADIANKYGAKTPFLRSAKNSDDFATTMDVLKEVVQSYTKLNRHFDTICWIYPAAVMITEEDLRNSQRELQEAGADFLSTVLPFSYPIQRALKASPSGQLTMNDTSMLDKRSQDLEVFYHDAGQFYWGKASSLATVNSIWAGTTIAYEVSPLKAQDIDNISDWNMAELKYRMLNFPKEN